VAGVNEREARGKILIAAEGLFAERGFEATTVRDIAAVVGVNLAMIHYYFGNKEGLYRAIFEEKLAEIQRIFATASSDDGSCRERLERFIRAYAHYLCTHTNLARIIQREMLNRGPIFQELFRPQTARNYQMLRSIINEGVERGEFRAVNVDMAPISLIGMIVFFMIAQPMIAGILSVGPGHEAFEDLLTEHTLNIYLHGVLQPADPGPGGAIED
jgi:AcrR family transcriptional regulator